MKLKDKKVLYVHLHNLSQVGIGIKNKIESQVKSFGKICKTCDFLTINRSEVLLNNKSKTRSTNPIISRAQSPKLALELLREQELKYDVIYMRGFGADPWLIKFLNGARPYADKIIYEFPTFPYAKELLHGGIVKKVYYLIDKIYCKKLKNYVDLSTNYNNLDSILGIKSLPLTNCVEVDTIKYTGSNFQSNTINLICVASLRPSHALDRVLKGIAQYYNKSTLNTKVKFDIIGDGIPFREELQQLANDLKIDEYVTFHGTISGEDLNPIFEKASIGIAPLGMHRSNNFTGSPLKVREYYARGLPMVLSFYDEAIKADDGINYLTIPANEKPLNVEKLIEWYKQETYNSQEMRETARNKFAWEPVLSTVLN